MPPTKSLKVVPPSLIDCLRIFTISIASFSYFLLGILPAGEEGFMKSAYRKFNIIKDENTPEFGGDDFAMMRQVLQRRFQRAMREDPERKSGIWPDLVLLDGGKGQLSAA